MSSDLQNPFQSLAPANDISGVDSYIEWLDMIIKDEKFCNIAITGDLGIGKSSVIRTFECKKKYKFIYLSASDLGYRFDDTNQINDNLQDSKIGKTIRAEEVQSKLEKDLLVQLISLCKRTDIPNSRFRTVPEKASRNSKTLNILYSFLCGLSVFCGGKLIANKYLPNDYLKLNFVPIQCVVLLLFWGITAGLGLYWLLTKYKLSKLSLGKEKGYTASAEIDAKTLEPEALDTNLHEILYLFEQLVSTNTNEQETRKPVFIIEDLDRYRSDICLPILTKLKQINNMLNNRFRNQNCGYGMRYKFIYLLNDCIFDVPDNNGKELLYKYDDSLYKFFDIIIPLLPKLGFTNSSQTIREIYGDEIDQSFIDQICCYVYDYRMLIDIDNEFQVYKERYSDAISQTSILAFVIYKVFYKKKYDQLYKGKDGEPISELLKSILMPDAYPYNERNIEPFEHILEEKFKNDLFKILQMSDAIKDKYKSEIVVKDGDTDFAQSDLSRIDLSGQDLHGRDFARAKLNGVNLRGANLSGADLSNADLSNADLRDADLRDANLKDADISESNLQRANLTSSKLIGASLLGSDLTGAILRSANLQNAKYNSRTKFPTSFKPAKRGMIQTNKTTRF